MPWIRLALFGLLTLVNLGLVTKYVLDNRFLYQWSLQWIDEEEPPSEKVVGLSKGFRVLRNTVDEWTGPERQTGAFGPLSLTPKEVVEQGGPCESKSRLMRTLLHLHGIESRRVLLLEKRSHTVTEADIENGQSMVVDPLNGLYFPRPDGGYFSLNDLAANREILRERIAEVRSSPGTGPAAYYKTVHTYLDDFSYANPVVSIGWRRDSALRELAHDVLALVVGQEWIETTSRPYLLERPVLMVLVATGGLQALVLASLLPFLASRIRSQP